MKRLLVLLSLLFSSFIYADTINLHWRNYDGTTYQDSTCVIDSDLILPATPPTRYGYTFTGWKFASYIPIEYIETNNGSFINTNFIPSNTANLHIKISFEFSSIVSSAVNGIFGYMNTSTHPRFSFFYDSGISKFGSGVNSTIYWDQVRASTGIKYTAELNNGVFSLVGDNNNNEEQIQIGIVSTNQTTYPIYLGSRCDQNAYPIWPSNIRIYKFELTQGGTHIDFIPVLDSNGTPCMYDRVTEQFYYNQGTGNFIAGPAL